MKVSRHVSYLRHHSMLLTMMMMTTMIKKLYSFSSLALFFLFFPLVQYPRHPIPLGILPRPGHGPRPCPDLNVPPPPRQRQPMLVASSKFSLISQLQNNAIKWYLKDRTVWNKSYLPDWYDHILGTDGTIDKDGHNNEAQAILLSLHIQFSITYQCQNHRYLSLFLFWFELPHP